MQAPSLQETTGLTKYASSIACSLTVQEMRELHRQALAEAEAKQTELRIVLASRYRDLVGSSEQVLDMKHSAQELDSKLRSLPEQMGQLQNLLKQDKTLPTMHRVTRTTREKTSWRNRLLQSPKIIYDCIDGQEFLGAALAMLDFLKIIQSFDLKDETNTAYPLAWAVLRNKEHQIDLQDDDIEIGKRDEIFQLQMKMTYLQLQTIPARIISLVKNVLLQSSEILTPKGAHISARPSAYAIAAYDLLTLRLDGQEHTDRDRAHRLVDLYLNSKATLIQQLLNTFSQSSTSMDVDIPQEPLLRNLPNKTEEILSLVVSVLQYDVILFSHRIFIQRKLLSNNDSSNTHEVILMSTLPIFDLDMVKNKVSNFLAIHLPLIRAKAKTVLGSISTASRLGNIRQLLYDKTDGVDVLKTLESWDEALLSLVDTRVIYHALDLEGSNHPNMSISTFSSTTIGPPGHDLKDKAKKFSLWHCLFSHLFSSLVHSILTTSFQSIHSRVISTLRTSLACAPPYHSMLPHEAHRNTLRIALELDLALKNLSDDAHELLVHAEEREESERRLRQSLYVHSCEIMGRLIHEIRRILYHSNMTGKDLWQDNDNYDDEATKLYIGGRLCHVLRFRLTTLSNLLDSSQLTSSLEKHQKNAIITSAELQSAFSVADDDDDGLISVDEAMDVMESAFSGTSFHGARMVRETLLLDSPSVAEPTNHDGLGGDRRRNVTLQELILLGARGLKLASRGEDSAMGTIQRAMEDIVNLCFAQWSKRVLRSAVVDLRRNISSFIATASTVSIQEWMRLYHIPVNEVEDFFTRNATVSPYLVSFFQAVSILLNQSICPADALPPILSSDYAKTWDLVNTKTRTLTSILRRTLLSHAFDALCDILSSHSLSRTSGQSSIDEIHACPGALLQLYIDLTFASYCYKSLHIEVDTSIKDVQFRLEAVKMKLSKMLLQNSIQAPIDVWTEKHVHILSSIDLFMSLLIGETDSSNITSNTSLISDGDTVLSESIDLYLHPLQSSCRFNLLPVQADRSLSELQVLGKLERNQTNKSNPRRLESIPGIVAANAVSSGLGFLSSMLGKK